MRRGAATTRQRKLTQFFILYIRREVIKIRDRVEMDSNNNGENVQLKRERGFSITDTSILYRFYLLIIINKH